MYRVVGRRKILSFPCSVHPPQQGAKHDPFLFPGQDRVSLPSGMPGLFSQSVVFGAGPLCDIAICNFSVKVKSRLAVHNYGMREEGGDVKDH